MSRPQPKPPDLCSRIRPDMSFEEWLQRNYQESIENLEVKILRIGSQSEVTKVLNWYRKRYEKELRQIRAMKQLTIFDYMEDMKNGNRK